jgi:Ca2+-binding RTX toxin-like protein
MATINNYFEQAQLSQAAYALNLEKGMVGEAFPGYVTKLIDGGMSSEQAKAFANKYKVIDQYTDPESGFSGTVFQDASGQIYMAIRGTEGLSATNDWSTNFADIGADGIAIDQAISMYNWYQRLIAPVGSTVPQYIYHKEITTGTGQGQEIVTPAWLEETSIDVTATGENAGGGLVGASNVAVTGHSLGGHLAMIMSRIAPNLVTSTLTYNAPLFDANLSTIALTSDGFFDLLRTVDSRIGSDWNIDQIINTRIEGDTVSLVGNLPGSDDQQQLFSENINAGWYDAHKMAAVTDALAVCNLFALVDSKLTLDSITGILKASSHIAENSLESAVSKIGELFEAAFIKRTGNEYDGANRDQLYKDIEFIKSALANVSNLTIKALGATDTSGTFTPLSPSEIVNLAQGDIAYRYALKHLNPFAVVGADYTKFNQNGELDIYDPATGKGQLSYMYLADRADMLANLMVMNVNDGYNESVVRFEDMTSGEVVFHSDSQLVPQKTIVFGSDQGEEIHGQKASAEHPYIGDNFEDHLYGMGGDDHIYGYGGIDHIEGGAGNDTLIGGKNDDILIGGAGIDTYVINKGDGHDTIIDSGRNILIVDDKVFAGVFTRVKGTNSYVFTSDDQTYTMAFNSPGTLTIDDSTSFTFANQTSAADFAEGDFSISRYYGPTPI